MHNVKLITAAILTVLIAVMILQNGESVVTRLLFVTVIMPHAILLFLTSGFGFATGALLTLSVAGRRRTPPAF